MPRAGMRWRPGTWGFPDARSNAFSRAWRPAARAKLNHPGRGRPGSIFSRTSLGPMVRRVRSLGALESHKGAGEVEELLEATVEIRGQPEAKAELDEDEEAPGQGQGKND